MQYFILQQQHLAEFVAHVFFENSLPLMFSAPDTPGVPPSSVVVLPQSPFLDHHGLLSISTTGIWSR